MKSRKEQQHRPPHAVPHRCASLARRPVTSQSGRDVCGAIDVVWPFLGATQVGAHLLPGNSGEGVAFRTFYFSSSAPTPISLRHLACCTLWVARCENNHGSVQVFCCPLEYTGKNRLESIFEQGTWLLARVALRLSPNLRIHHPSELKHSQMHARGRTLSNSICWAKLLLQLIDVMGSLSYLHPLCLGILRTKQRL